ncbi:MAG: BMP family ABC transporter substrate-binding protein [Clostridiaceae bacterium]|nr:BMP family ABC transporter substrate-binding protein [Clostridiaceae bacterium]
MKKILSLILVLSFVLTMFVGCGLGKSGYELALVTDLGTIDDKSFNQGSWEGLKKYAEEHKKTYQYYQPSEGTNAAYLESIDLAIKGGAKVIVTPGFLFEVPIYEAQTKYPEVKFVLLDGEPHTEDYQTYHTEKNVQPILYAEEEAGFMAGYAAVKDGFTKLGFQGGMAVPAVIRYGHGFAQGAEAAAKELNLAEGSVSLMYNYSGDFAATPESQARAAGWYKSGTEVIFACGGAVGNSVMAAAEAAGGKFVIGVDVDQYAESETVISSAMKMLSNSVYQALEAYYNNKWEGGTTWVLNASNDGVGLAMENARWRKFSMNDYNTLLKAVQDKKYDINNKSDIGVTELGLKYVNITEVKD